MKTETLTKNLKALMIAGAVALTSVGGSIPALAESDAELTAEIAAACGGDPACIAYQWSIIQAERCAEGRCFSDESVTCKNLGLFCPSD